jgi:uncharacterized protein (TIGR03435 family)
MSATRILILTAAAASLSFAQSTPLPEFEVASIRPSATVPGPQGQMSIGLHVDGSQLRISALTLKDYLGRAYSMRVSQIFGPDWIGSDRFDIAATIPAGLKQTQVPEMLQSLLADRFQLKFHREKRDFPVYALVAARGPLKLRLLPDEDTSSTPQPVNVAAAGSEAGISTNLGNGASWTFVPNKFEAKKLSMEQLATTIERFSDRPIVDMTGLKGKYDLEFDINPEDYQPMLIRVAVNAGATLPPQALRMLDGYSGAALSDALQKVGLRMEPRKAPLDVIVVNDAKKTPTEN